MATNLRNLLHNKKLIDEVEEEYGQLDSFEFYTDYYLPLKPAIQDYSALAEETFAWMNELLAECRETFKT